MVAKTTAGLGWLEEPSINTWWWSNYLNKDFLFWLLEDDLLGLVVGRQFVEELVVG